jgi:hypothetical protein
MIQNKVTAAVGVLIAALEQEIQVISDPACGAESLAQNPKFVRYAMDCALLRERLGRLLADWEGREWVDDRPAAQNETPVPAPPTPREIPKLALSRTEAAKALGVSAITVDRLVARGLLRPSLATRRPLFAPAELERFMRETSKITL